MVEEEGFWRRKGWYSTSIVPVIVAIVLLPISLPIVVFLLPVLAIFGLWWLSSYNSRHARAVEIDMQALHDAAGLNQASENEQPVSIAAKASSQPSPRPSPIAPGKPQSPRPPTSPHSKTSQQQQQQQPAPASAKAVGGGAILAKLRAQRDAKAKAASSQTAAKPIIVLYASQTGTAAEIAKNIHAGAQSRGLKSHVASMNEFGFDSMTSEKTPIVIFVASSTGDGDAPDNSAKFYAALRRKAGNAVDQRLKGISFTCLGLGDSNYTRYMAVPRSMRTRFLDLGADAFYAPGEADEVDGLEERVDTWMGGLWPALMSAARGDTTHNEMKNRDVDADGEDSVLARVANTEKNGISAGKSENTLFGDVPPPPPPPQIKLQWLQGKDAVEIQRQENQCGPAHHLRSIAPLQTLPTNNNNNDSDTAAATREYADDEYDDNDGSNNSSLLYSADAPFFAPVSSASYLTSNHSTHDRRVIHLDLDISQSGIAYMPGDAFGVLPLNDEEEVDALVQRLGVDGDAVFRLVPANEGDIDIGTSKEPSSSSSSSPSIALLPHVPVPCSVKAAFRQAFDLTSPLKKSLLRLFAEHCSDEAEKSKLLSLCSKSGRDAYRTEILEACSSLLDVLNSYPSCHPPLDALLDALPALPPRMYSIACSPLEVPGHVHAAFSVVRFTTGNGKERKGVATTWLEKVLAPYLHHAPSLPLRIPIFLRRGGDFKPPTLLAFPWIMIGPGTGVAPFRGFLQHRRALIQQSSSHTRNDGNTREPAVLYFGCRSKDQDYLYKNDLESFVADHTLDSLRVAFSRQQTEKTYVQHLMHHDSKYLYDLIVEKKGYIFVCGDGVAMAKDVHAVIVGILAQHGGKSEKDAGVELMALAQQGRYVRDIWS